LVSFSVFISEIKIVFVLGVEDYKSVVKACSVVDMSYLPLYV
jgi:hypothetical protein